MSNLEHVAKAAGTSLSNALKVTAYLRPEVDAHVFNAVYSKYLGVTPPARTLIISDLKTGAVEVDAIVMIP
jgi:enamine deaminase RidA (YjgF/YER057c/UK114 family)